MGVRLPDIFEVIFFGFSRAGSFFAESALYLTSLGPLNERFNISRGFMIPMFYCTSIR